MVVAGNFLRRLDAMRLPRREEVAYRAESVGSVYSRDLQIRGLCVGTDNEEPILCRRDAHLGARRHEGATAGGGDI
jgi:hypothetical protein